MADEETKCECPKGVPGWVVTFGDMMSLLLTFFIMLLSFSNMDIQKFKELLGSVEKAFGVQTEKVILTRLGQKTPIDLMGSADAAREKRKEALLNLLEQAIAQENLEGEVSIIKNNRGVLLQIKGSVMFDPGEAKLKEPAKKLFKKLIPIIKSSPYEIVVEGHTDNLPIKSDKYPSNWELSSARAGSVVRFFIEDGNLNPKRFTAEGYADTRPLFPNDTPEHRSKNRRVNIQFLIQ